MKQKHFYELIKDEKKDYFTKLLEINKNDYKDLKKKISLQIIEFKSIEFNLIEISKINFDDNDKRISIHIGKEISHTLVDYVEKKSKCERKFIIKIICSLFEILTIIWKNSFSHGNINPYNIYINNQDIIFLGEFGMYNDNNFPFSSTDNKKFDIYYDDIFCLGIILAFLIIQKEKFNNIFYNNNDDKKSKLENLKKELLKNCYQEKFSKDIINLIEKMIRFDKNCRCTYEYLKNFIQVENEVFKF